MYWVVDCLSVGGAREPEVEINEWSGKIKSVYFFCQKKSVYFFCILDLKNNKKTKKQKNENPFETK